MSALTFYIAKKGYAGLYLFFLFLLQNIDCGSRRGGSNVVRHSMFLAKIFKICITHLYNAWASFRNVTQLLYTYVVGVHEQMSQQAANL